MGRAFRRVQAFWPKAKTLGAGRIHFAQAFESNGVPSNALRLWADDKQLDDLSIAVTRMEQSDPEAEQ